MWLIGLAVRMARFAREYDTGRRETVVDATAWAWNNRSQSYTVPLAAYGPRLSDPPTFHFGERTTTPLVVGSDTSRDGNKEVTA
ncbi:hypothetical protein [Limobrevibacterium gyesilva]|uniref:Uncharacterized protein n=1 Tax=Limobrevibacterium gyesilva TaxID=2991712 RepID=A0AA41YNH7_9PROT|nr:hypothetical protein [Limobrevibacterium gyesilva]MCW3477141.1 hypothetical protein [Limobrevibacterium gyesilva]